MLLPLYNFFFYSFRYRGGNKKQPPINTVIQMSSGRTNKVFDIFHWRGGFCFDYCMWHVWTNKPHRFLMSSRWHLCNSQCYITVVFPLYTQHLVTLIIKTPNRIDVNTLHMSGCNAWPRPECITACRLLQIPSLSCRPTAHVAINSKSCSAFQIYNLSTLANVWPKRDFFEYAMISQTCRMKCK